MRLGGRRRRFRRRWAVGKKKKTMMMMEDGKDRPTAWDDLIDIQGRLASMALYRLPGRVPKHRVG